MRRRLIAAVLASALLIVAAIGTYVLMNSTTFQLFGGLTDRVATSEKVVALTFDDGPTAADADALLETLRERNVHATFYVNGESLAATPEIGRRMVADGHELGNHSWSGQRMVLIAPGTVARQVERTDAAIREAGYTGEITFRPPNGKKLIVLPAWLAQTGRRTIMWDVAVETFSGDAGAWASDIADATVAGVRPGSIVVLHPWNGRTQSQEAAGLVIDRLRAQGYRFVTVSQLLHL